MKRGDVTQLNALVNVAPGELEARLGYAVGRLSDGWFLLLLAQEVAAGDFLWGATTEFSGGTDPHRTEEPFTAGERFRPHVQDLKRYDLWKQHGFEEAAGDKAMMAFLRPQLRLLNDRTSSHRIAKVVPVVGDNGMPSYVQYPDAAPGHGVKQWTLRKPRCFRVAAKVPAGYRYLGGGCVGVGPET